MNRIDLWKKPTLWGLLGLLVFILDLVYLSIRGPEDWVVLRSPSPPQAPRAVLVFTIVLLVPSVTWLTYFLGRLRKTALDTAKRIDLFGIVLSTAALGGLSAFILVHLFPPTILDPIVDAVASAFFIGAFSLVVLSLFRRDIKRFLRRILAPQ